MSPFLTFAICLSIAYLLYYGANIGKDLYATGKQLTSNEEVFEIEDVPVETAVPVNEQGDGFFIGDAEPEETAEVLDPEKESEKKETAFPRGISPYRIYSSLCGGRSSEYILLPEHVPGVNSLPFRFQ